MTSYGVKFDPRRFYGVYFDGGNMGCCQAQPFEFDLTRQSLSSICGKRQPYIMPGADLEYRFKVFDMDTPSWDALDLTYDLLVMSIKRSPYDSKAIVRRSDTDAFSGGPKQISIDSQTTDNGPSGRTGRGWYGIRFTRAPADEDMLYSIGGLIVYYDIKLIRRASDLSTVTEEGYIQTGKMESVLAMTYPSPM